MLSWFGVVECKTGWKCQCLWLLGVLQLVPPEDLMDDAGVPVVMRDQLASTMVTPDERTLDF